jgi:hypothetical protein
MHPICGFLAIAQAAQGAPAETITVNHMRPSKLVAILNEIQPSTVLIADDERGVIIVKAGKEKLEDYRTYASLLDVKPRRVKIHLDVDSQVDRSSSSVDTVVANNKVFAFSDDNIGLDVKLSARINDDNTITMFVASTYTKMTSSMVFRVKPNENFSLCLAQDGTVSFIIEAPNKLPTGDVKVLSGKGVTVLRTEDAVPASNLRKWPILRFKTTIAE